MRKGTIKFGTDGWRGIIADDFTYEGVWIVGCAISRHVLENPARDKPALLIGYDARFASDSFAKLCAMAAREHGLPVYVAQKFVPTPSISLATVKRGASGAIMVTASHNPASYNGIKFKPYYGGSASAALTAQLEEKIHEVEENPPQRPDVFFEDVIEPGKVELFDPLPDYLNQVVSMVDESAFRKWNMKVLFDPMYGAGQGVFPEAAGRLGLACDEIHNVHNPLFPGLQPEPIGSNLHELIEEVTKGGYHVGIAVDGDADRVTAIDASGRFISSHMVFALLLKHLVEVRGQSGEVVKTVSTTSMIDDLCKRYGLKLHVVPVGFKYICDLMLESDILIGGEESGGTGIRGHIPERDGILVGLLLLEIMATNGKTLGELVDELMGELGRRYVYLRKDVELTKTQKEALLAELPSLEPPSIGGVKVERVEKIDGMKFYREDGSWLMLRVSGTEAMVRIYAEATSEEEVGSLVGEGEKMVERLPH